MQDLTRDWKGARAKSVPLLAVETPDPEACMGRLVAALNGDAEQTPITHWTIATGFRGLNERGTQMLNQACGQMPPDAMTNPPEALTTALAFPAGSVLFAETLEACWGETGTSGIAAQYATRMLRDPFKRTGRTLVVLAPTITLPAMLADDVITYSEGRPDTEQLRGIVRSVYAAGQAECAELPDLDDEGAERAVDNLTGLTAFSAEQALALALRRRGLDFEALAARRIRMINATKGLRVRTDPVTLADVAGCATIKGYLQRVADGPYRIGGVLILDEVDKSLAGAAGDTSGVSADALAALLGWSQDRKSADRFIGLTCYGAPGTGKTLCATAIGNELGVLTLQLDLGGTKSRYVGDSEGAIRNALSVADASCPGVLLCIATCNGMANLPPEFRRRFSSGTWFYDLPDEEERLAAWWMYRSRYNVLENDEIPDDGGWTASEIRECCFQARMQACSLKQAASTIVPVSQSAAEAIKAMRQQADGRFLSASSPGTYRMPKPAEDAGAPVRRMTLE